jgi:BlaI family penicillinase repressor
MLNATKQPRKALSELEHKIMQVLWKQGPVNSEQVRLALAARHPMKDSTIRTMLRRLQEKGYVKHRVEGRTFIYSGVEAPRNVAVRAVRQILDRFCEGSLEQLLTGLVENEVVDRAELQELARRVAEHKPPKGA